jgi:hypothetical protein
VFTWNIGDYFIKYFYGYSKIKPPKERSKIRFSATTTVTIHLKKFLWKIPQLLDMDCVSKQNNIRRVEYWYVLYSYRYTYTILLFFLKMWKEICMFVYTKDLPLTLKGKLELNFMWMTSGYAASFRLQNKFWILFRDRPLSWNGKWYFERSRVVQFLLIF